MTDINRRLRTLARRIGCPRHGELLSCSACQASAPVPPRLMEPLGRFIADVRQRVGGEAIANAMRRAIFPFADRCPQCQGRRVCSPCLETYMRAVLRYLVLTDEEQEMLEHLLATCRALELR
jgi:hypothetical protein